MTDLDLDARLSALLRDEQQTLKDDGFADRVVALAAYDLSNRKWRRNAVARIGRETLAFVAMLAAFAMLARTAPDIAGAGDIIPLASPAMLGLVVLLMWGTTTLSPSRQ